MSGVSDSPPPVKLEVVFEETEIKLGEPRASPERLEILDLGVRVLEVGVGFVQDLKQVDMGKWEKRKMQATKGGRPIKFKQYVPIIVSDPSIVPGKPINKVVYIAFDELLKQLKMS